MRQLFFNYELGSGMLKINLDILSRITIRLIFVYSIICNEVLENVRNVLVIGFIF